MGLTLFTDRPCGVHWTLVLVWLSQAWHNMMMCIWRKCGKTAQHGKTATT